MKLGRLDGDIRGLEVLEHEVQEEWEFSCTVAGPTFYSNQSQRD